MQTIRSLMSVLAACLVCTALGLAAGCATAPDIEAEYVRLTLTSQGTVLFDGRALSREGLPAALKSRGVEAGTPVLVSIPADAPMTIVKDLSRLLVSAGYNRVVFSRPRHADAGPVAPAQGMPRSQP